MSQLPTAEEQLWLEYVNRSRADPLGEFDALIVNANTRTGVQDNITSAIRFFTVDMALLKEQLRGYDPVAPLVWNTGLAQSADTHSKLMIDFDEQSHRLPGEPGLLERIQDAGVGNIRRVGENVFAFTDDPLQGHAGFYIDWGFSPTGIQQPPGHRDSLLSSRFTEIGIGMLEVTDTTKDVGPFSVTQHLLEKQAPSLHLLGVVIDDRDGDSFYDIGEGLANVSVSAVRDGDGASFSARSWDAGGYQMVLEPGTYTVTFSGGGLDSAITERITLTNANLKLDAIDGSGTTGGGPSYPCPLLNREEAAPSAIEVVVGTDGPDIFVFADGHGRDIVDGFDALDPEDKIDVTALSSLGTMADVLQAAAQVGADVIIATGPGSEIRLSDVALGDLDASDFLF